jgi:hypothetical protein
MTDPRKELSRIQNEFVATLTPEQRRLHMVGALSEEMMSPQQIAILKKMDPYLEGLTLKQTKQLALLDHYTEGYEKAREEGQKIGKLIGVFVIAFVILGFLALLFR